MARKNNRISDKQRDRNTTILLHAHALNLRSIDDYLSWCIQQGFRSNVNKSQIQLNKEYQHYLFMSCC